MSVPNARRLLRRNEIYQKLSTYCEEQGYRYEPLIGGKHHYIEVYIGEGKPVRMIFSASASDHRAANNALTVLKRLIRERQAANDNIKV
ncbi:MULTISPECIES: hypothetical protein [unclassified Bradyrhizobium]|uniref:hypothetical protein n=1 Tax=unclassified Bradyrhizobium TaxID=2631580 RepID=UPI002916A14C|nr:MULTISPECIES: hypothetical protein [unclassified Bradyrhizobium]